MGQEISDLDEMALRQLAPVARAFAEARKQVERYRESLLRQETELDLRSYVVVAVGLERILGDEILS